jgi:hypothetical protein
MAENKYASLKGKCVDVTRHGLPPYHGTLTKVTDEGLEVTTSEGIVCSVPLGEVDQVTLEVTAPEPSRWSTPPVQVATPPKPVTPPKRG